jgi:hypothetical protein
MKLTIAQVSDSLLFRAERYDGVDARCAAGGDRAGRQGYYRKNSDYAGQHQRVERANAVNLISHCFLQ